MPKIDDGKSRWCIDESLKDSAKKVQFTKNNKIQEATDEENAATQANLEAIDDPNGAMTTIFTSAPSANTSSDISLTLLLDMWKLNPVLEQLHSHQLLIAHAKLLTKETEYGAEH